MSSFYTVSLGMSVKNSGSRNRRRQGVSSEHNAEQALLKKAKDGRREWEEHQTARQLRKFW